MRYRIQLSLTVLLISSGTDAARAFFGFGEKPTAPAAAIGATSGETEFQAQGTSAWEPAAVGRRLKVGDRVRTQADGSAAIAFSNGSIVEIRRSADLNVEGLDSKTVRITVRSGLLRAWIVKMEGQSFEVKAPAASAATSAARFSLDVSAQGAATLDVYEGSVDLQSGAKTSRAAAGQRIAADRDGVLGSPVPLPATASSFPAPPQALIPTPRPSAPPNPPQGPSGANLPLPPVQPVKTISPSSP